MGDSVATRHGVTCTSVVLKRLVFRSLMELVRFTWERALEHSTDWSIKGCSAPQGIHIGTVRVYSCARVSCCGHNIQVRKADGPCHGSP